MDGAHALTVNTPSDGVAFEGNVGGTTALTSLTLGAGGITELFGNVTTSGAQTYGNAVYLFGSSPQTLTSTSNGAIDFVSTVDGAQALTVNTGGLTTFGGTVGSTTALTSLTTDAAGTTTLDGNVSTTGAQTYNDAVTLGNNGTLTGTTVSLAGGVIGGSHSLAILGNTTLGTATGLSLLSVTGTSTLNGNVSTTGTQSYTGAVTLGGTDTLTGTDVSLAGGVTGSRATNLTITGNTTLGTYATGLVAGCLGGTSLLDGKVVTTTGTQTLLRRGDAGRHGYADGNRTWSPAGGVTGAEQRPDDCRQHDAGHSDRSEYCCGQRCTVCWTANVVRRRVRRPGVAAR